MTTLVRSGAVSMAAPGLHFSFQEPAFGYFGQPLPGRKMMRYMSAPLFIKQVTLPRLRSQIRTGLHSRQPNKTPLIARLADVDGADIGAQFQCGVGGQANIAARFAAGEVTLDVEWEIAVDGADIGFGVEAEGGIGR